MANTVNEPGRPPIYRRMRGLRWNRAAWGSTLRLAADHILFCDRRGVLIERYKRFYFRDIEAFIVRQTSQWLIALSIWAALAGFLLLFSWAWHWNRNVTLLFEGIFAFFILRNLWRGPSCRTHVQTSVQTCLLPMLRRTRKTQRILHTLVPLIEEAQGKLESATVAGPVASGQPSGTSPAPVVAPSLSGADAVPPAKLSLVHLFTFVLALAGGVIAILEINFPSRLSFVAVMVFLFLSLAGAIVALVRQGKHPVHRGAAVMIWILLVSNVIGALGVQLSYTMFHTFSEVRLRQRLPGSQPSGVSQLTPFQMRHMAGFDSVLWAYAISSIAFGLLGLIFTLMPAPRKSQPPPLPPDKTA